MLNIALTGAQRYFGNISNILDLISNLNNKKLNGYTKIGQLTTLIETVAKEMEIEKFEIEPFSINPEVKLKLPPDIIELVLFKLLDNSKKFHPVNDPAIKINIAQIHDNVIITLSDDGIQLSAEEHIKIWTPYYQAEEKITGEVEGTGLGLSYIAQLMLKANGKYRSYNNENSNGITIELKIPSFIEL
jgi:K+-sensing histidine kinase KdpD